MDDVSIGPAPSSGLSPQPGVDAQSETQRDLDRGLAGIEAKPFSASTNNKYADAETTSAETDGRVSLLLQKLDFR